MTAYTLVNEAPAGVAGGGGIITWGAGSMGNSTSPRYMIAWSSPSAANSVENVGFIVLPEAGTLGNLRVSLNVALATDVVFTLRINGVDTAVTCTITAGGTTGSDVTHTAAVAAGDSISLKSVTVGAENGTSLPTASATYS